MSREVATFTSPLSSTLGGTGVSNNAASTITISGAFGLTITLSGTTSVTLPTSGSIPSANATTGIIPYLSAAAAFSDSQFVRVSSSQTDVRSGTTAQNLDVYITFTSTVNHERITVSGKGDTPFSNYGVGMLASSSGGTARDFWVFGGSYPNGQSNKAGANLVLAGGAGTGSGAAGQILFGLAAASGSGTSTNVHAQYGSWQTDGLHIGSSSATTGALVFENSSNTNKFTFSQTTPTANRAITIPDAAGTLVLTAASNTWSTGAQDMGSATSFKVPVSGGAAPTTSGFIAYDSTSNVLKAGVNGATVELSSYPISSYAISLPGASMVIMRYVFDRATNIPGQSNGTNATFKAGTAANAQADFSLSKNGAAAFATLRFAAAGTQATWQSASSTDFAAGDVLTVTAPSSQDSTLADLGLTIQCRMK